MPDSACSLAVVSAVHGYWYMSLMSLRITTSWITFCCMTEPQVLARIAVHYSENCLSLQVLLVQ